MAPRPNECLSCKFYHSDLHNMAGGGECRIDPPVARPPVEKLVVGISVQMEHKFGLWPKVAVDGWCGKYAK